MTAPSFDELIGTATARFREAGISDAKQNALLLMLDAFGGSRAALISGGASPAPEPVRDQFEADVVRRLAREPLQHIVGNTEFYGLAIRCDARALIPRFDSECVVEAALSLMAADAPSRVADLGTGTACLLAAVLHNRPLATGTGVEASPEAASLAQENIDALGLAGRASLHVGPWADWAGWREMDLILSNPPYIPSRDIDALEPEVRNFDPSAALDGGPDGLVAYREIIALGARRMKPGTPLVLEIGYDQREAVLGLLAAAGFADLGHSADLGGQDRCVWGHAPSRTG